MKTRTLLAAAVALTTSLATQAELLASISSTTSYHRATVDGIRIFYREAGPEDAVDPL